MRYKTNILYLKASGKRDPASRLMLSFTALITLGVPSSKKLLCDSTSLWNDDLRCSNSSSSEDDLSESFLEMDGRGVFSLASPIIRAFLICSDSIREIKSNNSGINLMVWQQIISLEANNTKLWLE